MTNTVEPYVFLAFTSVHVLLAHAYGLAIGVGIDLPAVRLDLPENLQLQLGQLVALGAPLAVLDAHLLIDILLNRSTPCSFQLFIYACV